MYLQSNIGEYSSFPVLTVPLVDEDSSENNVIREMLSAGKDEINRKHQLVKPFPPSCWTSQNCSESSFNLEQLNNYILPIYANFIETVNAISETKRSVQ